MTKLLHLNWIDCFENRPRKGGVLNPPPQIALATNCTTMIITFTHVYMYIHVQSYDVAHRWDVVCMSGAKVSTLTGQHNGIRVSTNPPGDENCGISLSLPLSLSPTLTLALALALARARAFLKCHVVESFFIWLFCKRDL